MDALVGGEVAFVHEAAIAVRAGKLPVVEVFIEMALQIHFLFKRLPAARHRALERLVPGMAPQVHFQTTLGTALFLAISAPELAHRARARTHGLTLRITMAAHTVRCYVLRNELSGSLWFGGDCHVDTLFLKRNMLWFVPSTFVEHRQSGVSRRDVLHRVMTSIAPRARCG